MSSELYVALCGWFIAQGTEEGIWVHLYLVLTWNLMCRVNSTSRICLNHISWYGDCLKILFGQTKGDQLGINAKYPRHVYANPLNHIVCPIFALALYMTTFNTPMARNARLFPGKDQFKRFGALLQKMLKAHEDDVNALGYQLSDLLGTHSIHKGAITYISSNQQLQPFVFGWAGRWAE